MTPRCSSCKNWVSDGSGRLGWCLALEILSPAGSGCSFHFIPKTED